MPEEKYEMLKGCINFHRYNLEHAVGLGDSSKVIEEFTVKYLEELQKRIDNEKTKN
jgi:hypothetical protein